VGRQACDVLLWVSFLLFPCLPVVVVGVAGWNMETGKVFCAPFFVWGVWGFGTLLGPEETPAGGWGFLGWPSLGPDRLTHLLIPGWPCWALWSGVVGGVVVVVVGGGVVVC
jgi:hypothetical protein